MRGGPRPQPGMWAGAAALLELDCAQKSLRGLAHTRSGSLVGAEARDSILLSFLIECTGVTLMNKMIQVTHAQFHNTPPVHLIVCSPPKPRLLPSPFTPTPSSNSPTPPPNTVICIHEFFFFSFFLNPSTPPSSPHPLSACSLPTGLSLLGLMAHFVH